MMARLIMELKAGYETIIRFEVEGRSKWVDTHWKRGLEMWANSIKLAVEKATPEELHGNAKT